MGVVFEDLWHGQARGAAPVLVERDVDRVHRRGAGVIVRLGVSGGSLGDGHGDHRGDTATAAGHERDLIARPGCVYHVRQVSPQLADAHFSCCNLHDTDGIW